MLRKTVVKECQKAVMVTVLKVTLGKMILTCKRSLPDPL
jgi:hypothetical protein